MAVPTTIRPMPASRRSMDDRPGMSALTAPLPPLTHASVIDANHLFRPWRPWAEIVKLATGFELRLLLPGVQHDEITVDVDADMLRVRGEDFDAVNPLRRGPFEYRAELPDEVLTDGVTAALQDGVLVLTVPSGDSSARRRGVAPTPRQVLVG